MNIVNFKELIVWQKSVDLSIAIYRLTNSFPSEEKFGLISQMRRCAVSIPSNIAEGKQRSTTKDYTNFLKIARGSLAELETQIIIAQKLKFIEKEGYNELNSVIIELHKMLNTIIRKLGV